MAAIQALCGLDEPLVKMVNLNGAIGLTLATLSSFASPLFGFLQPCDSASFKNQKILQFID
jgi:hypothetical protein